MKPTPPNPHKTLARIVARTWIDPTFKRQFVTDPEALLKAEGLDLPDGDKLNVLVDSADEVNLVLGKRATRSAAGTSRDLYNLLADAHNKALEDAAFRARLIADPVAALGELGAALPAGIRIHVHSDAKAERVLILPLPPNARIHIRPRADVNADIGVDEGGPAPAALLLKSNPDNQPASIDVNTAVNAVAVVNGATTADIAVAVAAAAVVVVIP